MNERLFATESPKPKQKFVAFLSDGSGCEMFICIKDKEYLNANGECFNDENLEAYLFWIPLPTEYQFWFEQWKQ